jgi:hypothetical protein
MEFIAVETAEEKPVALAADRKRLAKFFATQMRAGRAPDELGPAVVARIKSDAG